jgi:hypothetical protein
MGNATSIIGHRTQSEELDTMGCRTSHHCSDVLLASKWLSVTVDSESGKNKREQGKT